MFFSEEEEFNYSLSTQSWNIDLEYGNWEDGPNKDGSRSMDLAIPVPQVSVTAAVTTSSDCVLKQFRTTALKPECSIQFVV